MRISDWSSDVCSSDLNADPGPPVIMNTGQILRGEQVRCRVARTQSDGGGIAYGLCQDLGLFHAICHGEFAGFFVKKTGSLAFRPIKFQVALILTETDRKSTRLNSSH